MSSKRAIILQCIVAVIIGLAISICMVDILGAGTARIPVPATMLTVAIAICISAVVYVLLYHWLPKRYDHCERRFSSGLLLLCSLAGGLAIGCKVFDFNRIGGVGWPVIAQEYSHTLEIVATGENHPQAQGSDVWLQDVRFEDGTRLDLRQFQLEGQWETPNGTYLSRKDQPVSLKWQGTIRQPVILSFASHEWAGQVDIVWSGHLQQYDLYSTHPTTVNVTLPVSGGVRFTRIEMGTGWMILLAYVVAFSAVLFVAGGALLTSGSVGQAPAVPEKSTFLSRILVVVLLLFAVGIYSWQIYQYHTSSQYLNGLLADDAYITLRYAQNLADGLGPVWQGGDRVEGYSNFLWMVLLACGIRIGADPVACAQVLGVLFGFGVIIFSGLLVMQLRPMGASRCWPEAALASFLAACSTALAGWSLAGLETPMFACLSMCSMCCAAFLLQRPDRIRRAVLLGIVLAATAMTRPDGVLVAGSIFGAALLYVLGDRQFRKDVLKSAVVSAVLFGLLFGAYFLWRYSYYGYLLPNTFYVKVGSGFDQIIRGLHYLRHMTWDMRMVVLLVVAPFALLVPFVKSIRDADDHSKQDVRAATIMLLIFTAVYSLYLVYVGGDHFGARLAVPVYTGLCALAGVALSGLPSRDMRSPWRALLVVVVAGTAVFTMKPWRVGIPHLGTAGSWVNLGQWLADHAEPDDVIAVSPAGAIPYYSGLRSIDMLGLNDTNISHKEVATMGQGTAGHEKYDQYYVFSLQPDWYVSWVDRIGTPEYGMAMWPDSINYRPYASVHGNPADEHWLIPVTDEYDFSARFDEGYHFMLFKRCHETLDLDYRDICQEASRNGDWKHNHLYSLNFYTSYRPGDSIDFTVPSGAHLGLVFLTHEYCGMLRVESEGQEYAVIDLYSDQYIYQSPYLLTMPESDDGGIDVSLVILPGHNPASHSTEVHFGRILLLEEETYDALVERGIPEITPALP